MRMWDPGNFLMGVVQSTTPPPRPHAHKIGFRTPEPQIGTPIHKYNIYNYFRSCYTPLLICLYYITVT